MSALLPGPVTPSRGIRVQTGPAEQPSTAARPAEPADEAGEDPRRAVRIAEYTPFPRYSRHQRKRLGFTSDAGEPVLRVTVRDPEKVGTLLRVVVRGIDDQPQLDVLARVAWCEEKSNGHRSLGLAVVDGEHHRALSVRRSTEDNETAIRA